jgi:hypothetical protein
MSNFKDSKRAVFGAVALALLGAGCMDSDTDTDIPDVEGSTPITTLDTEDGVHVDFYEPIPGDLVAVVSGELSESLEGKRPVELYEALAGRSAPAELREIQTRIAAARALRDDDVDSIDIAEVKAPAQSRIKLTDTDFDAAYCNPGAVDFDYCWTSRTSDYSIDISSVEWIHSHVNVYSGQLTHRLSIRHPPLGSWTLINANGVTGSSFVSTYSEVDNGTYRVELTQAAGARYHLSIHGNR